MIAVKVWAEGLDPRFYRASLDMTPFQPSVFKFQESRPFRYPFSITRRTINPMSPIMDRVHSSNREKEECGPRASTANLQNVPAVPEHRNPRFVTLINW